MPNIQINSVLEELYNIYDEIKTNKINNTNEKN